MPAPGTLKWKFLAGNSIYSSPVKWGSLILVGANDRKVYAIDSSTGTKVWDYQLGALIDMSTAALAPDGTLFIGCSDGKLYALNPGGTLKWEFVTGGVIKSSPSIDPEREVIYFGSGDGKVYAVGFDGVEKWSYETAGEVFSSASIDVDGRIGIGSDDRFFYVFKPDGSVDWSYETGDKIGLSSAAIGIYGEFYIGSQDGKIYSLSKSGELRWSSQLGGLINSSPIIGHNGTIYTGANDYKLHALDPRDGSELWAVSTECYTHSTPAIDDNGNIYVVSYDHSIYCISPYGETLWNYATTGLIQSSSPLVDENGVLYIGSEDMYLYAIYTGSSAIYDSPWPKFKRDLGGAGMQDEKYRPRIAIKTFHGAAAEPTLLYTGEVTIAIGDRDPLVTPGTYPVNATLEIPLTGEIVSMERVFRLECIDMSHALNVSGAIEAVNNLKIWADPLPEGVSMYYGIKQTYTAPSKNRKLTTPVPLSKPAIPNVTIGGYTNTRIESVGGHSDFIYVQIVVGQECAGSGKIKLNISWDEIETLPVY